MPNTSLGLPAALAARFDALPPILYIRQIANFFGEKLPTIRQQIRRGAFPVTVRQLEGARQHVLLVDLAKYLSDGIPQPQFPLVKRAARNPFGRHGKRGRPTNAERSARARLEGGAK